MKSKPRSREDILHLIGVTNQSKNYKRYIEPLEIIGLVTKSIPDKPQSPNQRYTLTEKGIQFISEGLK